eukprot:TRINITY_DN3740_c0_g1_i4.p1 TRINITY_DN3740_c0_g1~~TRINITY_DN3740_c0_g1_i4.p1  ORF type:complete len:484 (-),score=72.26 TRINITY_DN3740_c0_g1_i4:339-1754(-)
MDVLRELVSQDKCRYKDANFNLDLTYITPNLIAMGFPASGVEGYFRNNIEDTAQYLRWRHNEKFLVLNLSSEKSYDPQLFDNKVLRLGFPDHHSPPLNLLFEIMLKMHEYLKKDKERVIAVHCLAGRGRTGTIICSYLVFSGEITTMSDALELYARRRSITLKGVSQPSQRRYAGYIDLIGQHAVYPKPRSFRLIKIRMGPVPSISSRGGIRPMLYVYNYSEGKEDVLFATDNTYRAKYFPPNCPVFSVDTQKMQVREPVILTGDIVLKLYHIHTFGQLGAQYIELVRLIFHTGMEFHAQNLQKNANAGSNTSPINETKPEVKTETKTENPLSPNTTYDGDASPPVSAKSKNIRDSEWGANLKETELVLKDEQRNPSVPNQTKQPIIFTFPLSGLDEAYKDTRFAPDFSIEFHLEEVPYQPKKKSSGEEKDSQPAEDNSDAFWNEQLYNEFSERVGFFFFLLSPLPYHPRS